MPIHANDVETLHDFAVGVMARAGHHASQVRAIALAMLGGIIWRVEPGSIEIRFHEGNLANALRWISLTGYEYACTYLLECDAANGGGAYLLDAIAAALGSSRYLRGYAGSASNPASASSLKPPML